MQTDEGKKGLQLAIRQHTVVEIVNDSLAYIKTHPSVPVLELVVLSCAKKSVGRAFISLATSTCDSFHCFARLSLVAVPEFISVYKPFRRATGSQSHGARASAPASLWESPV